MQVEILARLQFALTIMFHYIYPPLSIGLGLALVAIEGIYLKTRKQVWLDMAKFWTKVFALTFALGVGTGIVMEFEFGTNWAAYSRYVGDVFGSALAAEGVFAFFLESGFLAILLFGWNRVGPRMHFFSALMVCLGAHFSAVWIVVANSWMQTPAGFQVVGEGLSARAEIVDFSQMVFNPSSMVRLAHVIFGAWLAGAFLMTSVASFYLLKGRHRPFAERSLKIGLSIAALSLLLQAVTGDLGAKVVAKYQPAKLAAMEGLYRTRQAAPIYLFGLPNPEKERVDYGISLPGFLSFLAFGSFSAEVQGLDRVAREDRPHVPAVFHSYHLMLLCWALMTLLCLFGLFLWKRGRLFSCRPFLFSLVPAVLAPQVANQTGWLTAEMGRYPWIVQDLLRISEGLSKSVSAEQVLGSILMFGFVYLFLFAMFLYLLHMKIQHGPTEEREETPYHAMQAALEEKSP